MPDDPLTRTIIGAAIEVHRALGPGLLESAYRGCLKLELAERGLTVAQELPLPVIYHGQPVGVGYRLDLIVDDRVVVEVKSVEQLLPVHTAQLLSYLRLSNRPTGLLLNFNVKWLVEQGLRRVVNGWTGDS